MSTAEPVRSGDESNPVAPGAARRAPKAAQIQLSADERRSRRIRGALFAVVAVAILAAGAYLAGGVFLGQRGGTTVAAAIPMRISMAGFEPRQIVAKPGQTVTLDWWNTDGAMHLQNGVHTMVSDALGIRFELPAESRRTITLKMPMTPGTYDFWCDSCCGGRGSDAMHGSIKVEA